MGSWPWGVRSEAPRTLRQLLIYSLVRVVTSAINTLFSYVYGEYLSFATIQVSLPLVSIPDIMILFSRLELIVQLVNKRVDG